MTQQRRSPNTAPPTINVTGLVTQEAIELISEKVEEAIAQALDEARRMQSDVKR